MDVALLIRERLEKLGLEQRDLARAARVTESYVSQLLTGRKAPPAPDRTAIYHRMDKFLNLPRGELAKVAELHRAEEIKRRLGEAPVSLFPTLRALIVRKCRSHERRQIRAIVERQPFGELERVVARKLLDAAGFATDVFHLSPKQLTELDALIEAWDIDLTTFSIEIVLRRRAAAGRVRRFEFVERDAEVERGLEEFLADPSLSGTTTAQELEFLKGLRFPGRRPTALYFYRELQNLRDPLHFEMLPA
jgi:transcriptional regulator with XRE-family HTH domain